MEEGNLARNFSCGCQSSDFQSFPTKVFDKKGGSNCLL